MYVWSILCLKSAFNSNVAPEPPCYKILESYGINFFKITPGISMLCMLIMLCTIAKVAHFNYVYATVPLNSF